MIREHRHVDWASKKLTVTPFTAKEKREADQRDDEDAAKEAALEDPGNRVDRAFDKSDTEKILRAMVYELKNEIRALQTLDPLTPAEFDEYLQGKLP